MRLSLSKVAFAALFFLVSTKVLAQSVDWQKAVGGKMSFEVASVKQDLIEPSPYNVKSNVDLSFLDAYVPTGGLLSATNQYLEPYIAFAYKLDGAQAYDVYTQLPKWATKNRYDIQARAPMGDPTKDQLRVMVQSLLAGRFGLVAHFKSKQQSVYGLVLAKPGKLGKSLRPYTKDPPCPVVGVGRGPAGMPMAAITDPAIDLPTICGSIIPMSSSKPGFMKFGGRNVSMTQIAELLKNMPRFADVDEPVVDHSGLTGTFDFTVEFWSPLPNTPEAAQTSPSGPTALEALKDQLGMKLQPARADMFFLKIDQILEPTEN